jgi:hypothetical protein
LILVAELWGGHLGAVKAAEAGPDAVGLEVRVNVIFQPVSSHLHHNQSGATIYLTVNSQ